MESQEHTPLSRLSVGKSGRISRLPANAEKRRRLLDLGLIVGTQVTVLQKSPFGDPTAYEIRGAVIALRGKDAENVLVLPDMKLQ